MKTKFLALVLAVMLLFTATSCSLVEDLFGPKLPAPDTVVTAFVDALAKGDFEAAGKLTSDPESWNEEFDKLSKDLNKEFSATGIDADEFVDTLLNLMFSKSEIVEFGETTIDGDIATVDVTVSAPDLEAIIENASDAINNMSSDELLDLVSGLDDPTDEAAIAEILMDIMFENIEDELKGDCDMIDSDVTVSLIKGETAWLIDGSQNEDLVNALIGQM